MLAMVAMTASIVAWGASASSAAPKPTAATVASSRAGHAPQRSVAGRLDLAKLGALSDYTARTIDNGRFTETFRVHSPNDWEVFVGRPTPLSVNVNGSSYGHVPHVKGLKVTYSWQRIGPAQPYKESPYPSYATGFAALTHVAGTKLVRGGVCRMAGIAGHLWHFAAAAKGAVYPHVTGCIADRSGALLSYGAVSTGIGVPAGFTATFAITGVGDVRPIPIPIP